MVNDGQVSLLDRLRSNTIVYSLQFICVVLGPPRLSLGTSLWLRQNDSVRTSTKEKEKHEKYQTVWSSSVGESIEVA